MNDLKIEVDNITAFKFKQVEKKLNVAIETHMIADESHIRTQNKELGI